MCVKSPQGACPSGARLGVKGSSVSDGRGSALWGRPGACDLPPGVKTAMPEKIGRGTGFSLQVFFRFSRPEIVIKLSLDISKYNPRVANKQC